MFSQILANLLPLKEITTSILSGLDPIGNFTSVARAVAPVQVLAAFGSCQGTLAEG
jgi:hypothetical protein